MTTQEPMGFAGLASLASTLPPMPLFDPPPITAPPAAGSQPAQPTSPRRQPFWTKGKAWAAAGVIGFVTWGVINANDERRPSPPTYSAQPTYTPPQRSTPPETYRAPVPAQSSPAATEVETKPSVGRDLTHSRAELRYCFAEKVRLGTMLDMIDDRNSTHVRNVNVLVDDYNSRCGSYRYRTSDHAAAQASVDANMAGLAAQARARVAAWR